MVTIAGGIILAVFLLALIGWLISLVFSAFQKSALVGCFTMVLVGIVLLILVGCLFG